MIACCDSEAVNVSNKYIFCGRLLLSRLLVARMGELQIACIA